MESVLSRTLSTFELSNLGLLKFIHTTYEKNVLAIWNSGKIETNSNEHLNKSLCYFYYGMMRPQNTLQGLASYHNQFAFSFSSEKLIKDHFTLYPFDTGAVLRRLSQLPQYNHLTSISAIESRYRLYEKDDIGKLIQAVYISNDSYRDFETPFSSYNSDRVIEEYMKLIENSDAHSLTDSRLRFIELSHDRAIELHDCSEILVLERSLSHKERAELMSLIRSYSNNVSFKTFSSQYNQELLKQNATMSGRLEYYTKTKHSDKPFKAKFMIDVCRNSPSYIKLVFTYNIESIYIHKVEENEDFFEINVEPDKSETYLIHYSSHEIKFELEQKPSKRRGRHSGDLEVRFNRPIVYTLPTVFHKIYLNFSDILTGIVVFKINNITLIKGDSYFVNKMILKFIGTLQDVRNLYIEVLTTCLQFFERGEIDEIVSETIEFYEKNAKEYTGWNIYADREMNGKQDNLLKFPSSNFIIFKEQVYGLDEDSTIMTKAGEINTIDFFRMRNNDIVGDFNTEIKRCRNFLKILKGR